MELYEGKVKPQPSLTLPWDEVLLLPISDLQFGAPGCDFDKFKRHIEWGLEHNAYFIGAGDYFDVASPSGRKKIRDADFYDSVTNALQEQVMQHYMTVMKVLAPTRGQWLGLVEGHHYYEFANGETTDTMLAAELCAPYLGTCGIVQVRFDGHDVPTAQVWIHHGQGSGVTMAGPLSKLERIMSRFPEVDVFLIGHYSRKVAYPVDVLVAAFDPPRLKAKRRILAVTGGFVRGYIAGGAEAWAGWGDLCRGRNDATDEFGGFSN